MNTLPTVSLRRCPENGDYGLAGFGQDCRCMAGHRLHPYSLLPGSDWFLFGGVAIQADPCGTCDGTGECPFCHGSGVTPEDHGQGLTEYLGCQDCRASKKCVPCHGLGVIPRHGSIVWKCFGGVWDEGCLSDESCAPHCSWGVWVPIEGDE